MFFVQELWLSLIKLSAMLPATRYNTRLKHDGKKTNQEQQLGEKRLWYAGVEFHHEH
jgi:hypothetical protein